MVVFERVVVIMIRLHATLLVLRLRVLGLDEEAVHRVCLAPGRMDLDLSLKANTLLLDVPLVHGHDPVWSALQS